MKLIERLNKLYSENKEIQKVMSEQDFKTFTESFESEFKKIKSEAVKEAVKKERKKLTKENNLYLESMKKLYEKRFSENLGDIIQIIIDSSAKSAFRENLKMTDKYFVSVVKEQIEDVQKSVKEYVRRVVKRYPNKMESYIEATKKNYAVLKLEELIRTLGLVENVDVVGKLKVISKKYNEIAKENKKLKRAKTIQKMNSYFNEAFSDIPKTKKSKIKEMLKSRKFSSFKEFKKEVNIIKSSISEGVLNFKDMKKSINERNNKKYENKTIINNNTEFMEKQNMSDVEKKLIEAYKKLK